MTGPSVVAVGGGHGLASTLRALRRYAGEITAVVSVADDGGSSGRLRDTMPDLPAPGDVRRCLAALAADGSALGRALEHRYGAEDPTLAGHAFGNLLLARLAGELGSFPAAVDEVAAMVGVVGRVLPATVGPVTLEGHRTRRTASTGTETDAPLVGQVAVQNASGVTRIGLTPADPASPEGVGKAIAGADQVVLGPGSLFTSVLAAAIVPAVRKALEATSARRIYVANLAGQVPETEGFTLADHLAALAAHRVPVDVVVAAPGLLGASGPLPDPTVLVVEAAVADDRSRVHHPELLATVLDQLVG
ncbi:hypothetical protein BH23ACT2_BH23ACT2_29910 [soil metagenome]